MPVKNATTMPLDKQLKIKSAHWVCQKCGTKYGRGLRNGERQFTISTWHIDNCDVCGKNTAVTETRDFGYLKGQ